jgi:transposase
VTTILENIKARRLKGWRIASLAKIEKVDGFFAVPSVTSPVQYKVDVIRSTCTCPDFETRQAKCKHIFAAEFSVRRDKVGFTKPKVKNNQPVAPARKTYAQNWPAYNLAQQNEKREFQTLLASLCQGISSTEQEKPSRGRPAVPLADTIFSVVYKVYSTFSGRRFTSDLCDAQANGFIGRVPHYNTAFRCMENPEVFPILLGLIEQSSLPLRSIESNFAVDSTGFAYSRFVRWYDIKYNRFTSEQQWVKAHMCCGVKTNVVTAVEIKDMHAADACQLPGLVEATAKNFTIKEVLADKGYSGRESHDVIAKVGATPFIAFKANATGGVGGLYEKMYHYFQLNREDFLAHYHQRSNIESTVMMIKTKFGDAVRSKSEVAAKNEVLAKILCHNICCLISAMYELGITPEFS